MNLRNSRGVTGSPEAEGQAREVFPGGRFPGQALRQGWLQIDPDDHLMKHRALIGCLLFFLSTTCAQALELGSLSGVVKEPTGQPAVGVAVALYSTGSTLPIERKTLSDLKGQFQFTALFPGSYILQVFTVAPWSEVSKALVVTPGRNDSLVIHLSDILTLAFKPPRITAEGDDRLEDAKWVLRTSRSTRPILRFRDNPDLEAVAENSPNGSSLPFRGVLEISSASEVSNASLDANSFNSTFAFIHTLSPTTQLLVAGGVGFLGSNQASVSSALNFKLDDTHTATVTLGLRQFGLPLMTSSELSQVLASISDANGTLSQNQNLLVSLDLQDRFKLGDHIEMMGGLTFDHLESVRTRNMVRPRVGITADLSPTLTVRALAMNTTLERAKTFNMPEGESISLPSIARMTLSPNSTRAESVNHVEMSFDRKITERTRVVVSFFQDQFRDRTLLLSNFDSIDVGGSTQRGYGVALLSHPTSKLSFSLGYNYAGGLEESDLTASMTEPGGEGTPIFKNRYYHIVTGGMGFQLPRAQTQVNILYRKILGLPLTLIDPFQSNFFASEAGLNLVITQPLPNFTLLPGQLEAQADFRNLFSEGSSRPGNSLPIDFLSQQARVIRGGLSLKF